MPPAAEVNITKAGASAGLVLCAITYVGRVAAIFYGVTEQVLRRLDQCTVLLGSALDGGIAIAAVPPGR
ncbi:hypothetical protein, partial [Streptomyces sp. NPDC006324]|uniref:hypothetical protein n=1 Tax=Streptomyces sp. NPDC006324 TaxID=3156751 RepID=UPI0033BBD370